MGRESNHVCRDTIHVNSENPSAYRCRTFTWCLAQQETRKVKLQEVRVEIKVREESESQSKIKSQKISRSPEDKAN
jgi:hypothetical protein